MISKPLQKWNQLYKKSSHEENTITDSLQLSSTKYSRNR